MKFYTLEKPSNNLQISSAGIDLSVMGKVFKAMGKNSELETLDQVMDFNLVFLDKTAQFPNSENLVFIHKDKKLNFAVAKANTIFEIKEADVTYYCAIHESTLKTFTNKSDLEAAMNKQTLTSKDPIINKAIKWLEEGQVGSSSATMCRTLFPRLKEHHNLKSMISWDGKFESSYPHDNGDFGRCVKFLEAVPEAREMMPKLKKLNEQWEKLVDNWTQIETLISQNKVQESYELIKECVNKPKKMKP